MDQMDRCAYCGAVLSTQDRNCPNCGAPNPHYLPDTAVASPGADPNRPRTVSELQAYCASRGMPLERMRFFIGVDYRRPRAFGIYRDGSDFVVYKNKADGSRAIRYRGPDEAFAVGELYDKLMAEHTQRAHLRMTRFSYTSSTRGGPIVTRGASGFLRELFLRLRFPILFLAVLLLASNITGRIHHRNDGYYRVGEDLYYRYGSSWFADTLTEGWYEVADFPYSDYQESYQGDAYDATWGGASFTDSQIWEELTNSDGDGCSYDYNGWDAGDTNWDSDW